MIGMSRRPRIHYPGAVYHVMARGVNGQAVFIDDLDRRKFLRSLERIKLETGATIYAFCLMGNHFHLAIKVATVPLCSVIQRILTGYSITFNQRHGRTGHVFQARYKSILCLDDRYLLGLIQYIQMNPVRAGLVESPMDWPWSSRSPVEAPNLDEFDPWQSEDVNPSLTRPRMDPELTLSDIGARACEAVGIELGSLRTKTKCRRVISARIRMAREGVRNGYKLVAIADWLGLQPGAVSYYLRKNSTNSLA